LIGPAKTKVIDSIFNVGLSCETYRESEAGRLMKIGRFLVIKPGLRGGQGGHGPGTH